MRNRILAFVALSLILNISVAFKPKGEESRDIQNKINQLVKQNEIPGLNFSIIYPSGVQQSFSSGLADIETNQKLTPEHVMFSGSIGKTYAVAIIMQLVDAGKIDLKKKFIEYFPQKEWLSKLANIEEITVEMLLMHTTGLPRYINHQGVWDSVKSNPDKVWSYKDRLSFIFDEKPVHVAGKGWAYSDTNYILLGMLIEKITGEKYYDLIEKRVLKPGDLKETHAANKREIKSLANGYSRIDAFFRMPQVVVTDGKYAFNPQMEWTGGGMASTTSDLAKWAKIYYEHKLFSKASLEKIIEPNKFGNEVFENTSYGMGSFIYNTKHGNIYGHTGFVPGFISIFAYYPMQKLAVALQINCDYGKSKMSLPGYLEEIMDEIIE